MRRAQEAREESAGSARAEKGSGRARKWSEEKKEKSGPRKSTMEKKR